MKKWVKLNLCDGIKYLKLFAGSLAAMAMLFVDGEYMPEASAEPAKQNINAEERLTGTGERDFGRQTHFIVIHKRSHKLEVFEKGNPSPVRVYDCAVGKNPGDKQWEGDMTTPVSWGSVIESEAGAAPKTKSSEIPFVVVYICHAGHWSHDFKDGNGVINGAYGPWFISLNTGWAGIGIHGTHDLQSIGTNATEGCIRLHNKDIDELKKLIFRDKNGLGVKVVITED